MRKRIFCGLFIIACLATLGFTLSACGGDDEGDYGVTENSIVGEFTAVTSNEYIVKVNFDESGGATIASEYVFPEDPSYQRSTYSYDFTNNQGTMTKTAGNSSTLPKKLYIKIIEGFVVLTDGNGDVFGLFYKNGRNLGSAKNSKIVGTWKSSERTLTIDSNNTGTLDYIDRSYQWGGNKTYSISYKMKNSYVVEVTHRDPDGSSSSYIIGEQWLVLGNNLYMLRSNGKCYYDSILTKQ